MGPRKRPKPNTQAEAQPQTQSLSTDNESPPQHVNQSLESKQESESVEKIDASNSSFDGAKTPQSTKNWYGGSWPRTGKATPVSQVAKESVAASREVAFHDVAPARADDPQIRLKSPTGYLSRDMGGSSRSLPLAATTTKLNISSSNHNLATGSEKGRQSSKPKLQGEPSLDGKTPPEKANEQDGRGDTLASPVSQANPEKQNSSGQKALKHDSASWRTWFYKAETPPSPVGNTDQSDLKAIQSKSTDQNEGGTNEAREAKNPPPSPTVRRHSKPTHASHDDQQKDQPRSWMSLWGTIATQTKSDLSANATGTASIVSEQTQESTGDYRLHTDVSGESICLPRPPPNLADPPRASNWGFWSKNAAIDEDKFKRSGNKTEELAQVGLSSRVDPDIVTVEERRSIPNHVEKRKRPPSHGENVTFPQTLNSDVKRDFDQATIRSKAIADTSLKGKREVQNLLLPAFKHTYRTLGKSGLIQQLSRLFQSNWATESKRIEIVPNPPRLTRALAIGVHGYFPAPLIRSVLGQPTGTSIRFANSAANAISKWTQVRGYSCDIEKVALEGEGKIAERIELLWKLLLNWVDKIQKADFVLIACHSQGVPVAMMLISKLIAFGCVNSAKIGVCAMAGVNLGPFAEYKSRWISGSAGELFEFADSDSQVSKDYGAALNTALSFGVRVVYVGSIDDQLVSLESATFGTVSHPYIYRAVFVNGRVHAPDFLTHLVGFALKLRNLGIPDHGLIRELSSPLAGSLYGGEGHSRIYEDESVYSLAVEHALETSSVGNVTMQLQPNVTTGLQNPYILPFAMRGLLEEEYVRTEMHSEITELIRQFDDWKPSSKVLKDVKFRLEGVRSKL